MAGEYIGGGSSNTLTGPSAYSEEAVSDSVDGVIFSRADLCINGGGSLIVTASSGHGVVSKDDLVVTGGNIDVTAAGDGLQGKDCVKIKDGTFTINAENDGIHADSNLSVTGGTLDITQSYEGIEGNTITVDGGDINITASDDGLNAAGGADGSSIDGRAGQDPFAVDESAFIEITGGTFIGTGAVQMAQSFSSSEQGVVAVSVGEQAAGSVITLTDGSGNEVMSHEAPQSFAVVILSSPDIASGETYILQAGSASGEVTAD